MQSRRTTIKIGNVRDAGISVVPNGMKMRQGTVLDATQAYTTKNLVLLNRH